MFSTPVTSVHVWDKNREISLLEREESYGGKDLEKKVSFKTRMEDPWDTPTTDLGAESEQSRSLGMEKSTLRWPIEKEREEMEEVCSIGVP